MVLIPMAVVLYMVWRWIERSILKDVARCLAGQPVMNGIPHHGIIFVKSCVLLLGIPIAIGMIAVAIFNGIHIGVIVFGVSSLVTNTMAIVAVLVLRRIERGFDPMINYDGRKVVETPMDSVSA